MSVAVAKIGLWMLAFLLAGCAASPGPFTRQPSPALDAYAARIERSLLADTGTPTRMAERNSAVDAYLFLCDLSFRDYATGLYVQVATFSTAADLLALGLSAGATVVGGEATKAGLSAASTLVQGGKAIVASEFYEQQAKTPLLTTMRELRAAKRADIETGKRKPVREYTLSTAMLDVLAYCSVDVVAAIQKLTERSTQALVVQQENLDAVRALPTAQDDE